MKRKNTRTLHARARPTPGTHKRARTHTSENHFHLLPTFFCKVDPRAPALKKTRRRLFRTGPLPPPTTVLEFFKNNDEKNFATERYHYHRTIHMCVYARACRTRHLCGRHSSPPAIGYDTLDRSPVWRGRRYNTRT